MEHDARWFNSEQQKSRRMKMFRNFLSCADEHEYQKIVGNSFQPICVIITGNPIHQSVMLRGTRDPIGQLGFIANEEFPSIL